VALVLGLALLAGCGGSDEPSPAAGPATSTTADTTSTTIDPTSTTQAPSTASSTPTPPATVPTTAAPDPEAEVKAAYLQIMDAYFSRLQHPDPADPEIAANHTGASLEAVKRRTAALQQQGAVDRFTANGPPIPKITQVEVRGDGATVTSCIINDVIVVRAKDDYVLNGNIESQEYESTLAEIGGRWKLSTSALVRKWADEKGCDR